MYLISTSLSSAYIPHSHGRQLRQHGSIQIPVVNRAKLTRIEKHPDLSSSTWDRISLQKKLTIYHILESSNRLNNEFVSKACVRGHSIHTSNGLWNISQPCITGLEPDYTKEVWGWFRGSDSLPYISIVCKNSSLAKLKGRKVIAVYPLVIVHHQWCRSHDDTAWKEWYK